MVNKQLLSFAASTSLFLVQESTAWSLSSPNTVMISQQIHKKNTLTYAKHSLHMKQSNFHYDETEKELGTFYPDPLPSQTTGRNDMIHMGSLLSTAALFYPISASAADSTLSNEPLKSALAAYSHYFCIIWIACAVVAERLTVKPNMDVEDEKFLAIVDISLGITGVLLLVSGYYRATEYGKGWDFYSHEPIFWLKMAFLGVFGGLSLFPTITIIKRSVALQTGQELAPMSEKLANRLKSVLNAELSAIAFIPLTASLMARGVGYVDGFPTQIVGPALFAVITAGACYKYAGDALAWKEE